MAWVMALAMVLTLFGGCKKAEEAPLPVVKPAQSETNDRRFTIGWVSDPQWYSFKYFEHLTAQNDWIVENYDRLNMKYIVHTGCRDEGISKMGRRGTRLRRSRG